MKQATNERLTRMALGCKSERGFSLVEIIVAVFIIGVLALVLVPKLLNPKDDATVVACAANQRAIATDLEGYWEQARRYPSVEEYRQAPNNLLRKLDGIYYLVDGDPNSGHGNDIDQCDEDNPGKSGAKRDCLDIRWVLVCNHNHGEAAAFVYTTDQGVPTMVLEGREPPPGSISLQFANESPADYQRFINLQWK